MNLILLGAGAGAFAVFASGFALGRLSSRAAAPRSRRLWTAMRSVQIGEFLSFVLYQLREYLISVTSIVEALSLSAPKDQPSLVEKLERLRRVVGELNVKAARLLGDQSAVTTQAPGKRTSFGLFELVSEAFDAAKAEHPGVPGSLVKEGSIPSVTGDRRALMSCLLATLENAFSACERRGQGRVSVSVHAEPRRAQVEIADEGGGIDEAFQGLLFEPLYAARGGTDGLGLGLPMSRRLLERLGGTIRVKSKPPFTAVLLELPVGQDLPFVRNEESTWAGRRDRV